VIERPECPGSPGRPESLERLVVRGLTKRFPGVLALDAVDVSVRRGEVLAVVGENGAGKSTLMKVLAGIVAPDAGEIELDGRPARIDSTRRALELGIALIHQEPNLADNLTAAANIRLGNEPARLGFFDSAEIEASARAALAEVGADFGPEVLVRELPVGRRQLVEIAKALARHARILLMDEPTSSLSGKESERLLEVVDELRARGVSIVYISHRLAEVKRLADRAVVLRDGRRAGELDGEHLDRESLVRLMVGRDLASPSARPSAAAPGGERLAQPVLEVQGLVVPASPRHALTFEVRAGERVGLAGLVGAGRTELLRVLFGIDRPLAGRMRVGGAELAPAHPRDAIRAGVGLVPEDRKRDGLFLPLGVRENVGIATLARDARAGFVDAARERTLTAELVARLCIGTPGVDQPVEQLSGGNQQKVVLARWLATNPRLLLLDEPTRGIDVGARHEIYELIDELARQGVAVLFASSEMEELLELADRVLVMHEGRIAGELARAELDEERVMRLATGGDRLPVGEAR